MCYDIQWYFSTCWRRRLCLLPRVWTTVLSAGSSPPFLYQLTWAKYFENFFYNFFVQAHHQFEHLNSLMRQSQKILVFFKFFAHIRRRGSVHSAGNFHIVSVPVWRGIKNLCPWFESKISKWSAYFVWMNASSCSISGLCWKEENSWSCFQIIFGHQLSSNNCSPLSIWSWSSSLPSSTSWSSPEHQGQSWPGQQNPTHCQRSTCTLRSGAGLSWGTSTDRLSPGTRCILIRL